MTGLHVIDMAIIGAYLFFILMIGLRIKGQKSDDEVTDFLLGGRQLTLPAFIATLVSTWYGGILGVGEFTYLYGIANWLVFGMPYYIAAVIFALFLAKKARRENLFTIPQQVDVHYGRTASLVAALFVFIVSTPAPYILMLGLLLRFFFHWPLWICISIGTFFSIIYVFAGGFRSVVKTDALQFILMYCGFLLIVVLSIFKFGGLSFLKTSLPSHHFVWHGGQGAAYIIVWYFIALATLIEPAFYQRCFAAKNETTARTGILVSVLFWIGFDFLTTTAGLYARAVLPNMANPATSYLGLATNVLPPVLLGLFITGLLATIMSTVDSYTFIAAITIGRDYLWRIKKSRTDSSIPYYTRIGIFITGAVSIAIAVYGQSIIRIWKDLGSLATPTLLIPVFSSFWPSLKMQRFFALLCMLAGAAVSGFWMAAKEFGSGVYPFRIEPIYPGLLVTLLIYAIDRAVGYIKKRSGPVRQEMPNCQ